MLKKEVEKQVDDLQREMYRLAMEANDKATKFEAALDYVKKAVKCLKGEVVAQKERADRAEGYIKRVHEDEAPEERRRVQRRQPEPHHPDYRNLTQAGRAGWAEDELKTPWYAL